VNLSFADTQLFERDPNNDVTFTSNSVTLKAGKVYKLSFDVSQFVSQPNEGSDVQFAFYNVTGATYFGNPGRCRTASNAQYTGQCIGVIAPTVDTTINVRVWAWTLASGNSVASVGGANGSNGPNGLTVQPNIVVEW
jgi:Tfp pilus assembly protein PilV